MALTPINPRATPPQAQTPPAQPASEARAAAQRAFFEAALGKAGASLPVVKAPAAQAAAPPPSVRGGSRAAQPAVAQLQDETVIPPHPGRILRPGSLVDIKV